MPDALPDLPRSPATRTERVIDGAILPTMLGLALPTVAVLLVQTFVSVLETYFVSALGTDAVAGVALVFPVLMLMTTMSNGGIGGGVSSAVARAIGAGRREDADRLVFHALLLAAGFGALFTAATLALGPTLYSALGGSGPSLDVAVRYSAILFAGAIPIWSVNLLASALRGAGNVKVPALIVLGGAALLVPLSPALIFGFGPLPAMGVAGAGVAVVLYYLLATAMLVAYLRGERSTLRLGWARPERRLFAAIMSVGAISALGTLQGNFTLVIITGAVGAFGTDALAGYGLASRLDGLLIPVIFGLGTAVLTMVGINVGASRPARAKQITLVGALVAFGIGGGVGFVAALTPQAWLNLFTGDAAVLAAGSAYLRVVAPTYAFIAAGLLLYFASQGAGRVGGPFVAGAVRLAIAGGVGWMVVTRAGATLHQLFLIVAFANVLFGALNLLFVIFRPWGEFLVRRQHFR